MCTGNRTEGSNPSLSASKFSRFGPNTGPRAIGRQRSRLQPVCTPAEEASLQTAIAGLTELPGVVPDEAVPARVDERRALRDELRALQEARTGAVQIEAARERYESKA
jgi:hypothetical protein